MKKAVVSVRNLSKTYSGITVLKNVSFDLYPGEVNALIGENGAGKSTLIKIIAGTVKPDQNSELFVEGKLVHNMTPYKSMQMGIAVIYQDISMFPNLTIAENLFMGRREGAFYSHKEACKKTIQAFKDVQIDVDPNARLGDLSLGQQQIVAIVKAVTSNAKVVIMDEPTASLTGNEVELLFRLVRMLKQRNVGVVYISHRLEEIFALADRITVLRDGELVACDTVDQFDYNKLVRLMVGRELRFVPMLNEGAVGETLFEVKNLNNAYAKDVSFQVHRNEILGLTGLVGAGRSETAESIFGLRKIDSGEIYIHGQKVDIQSPKDAIAKGISFLTEDRHSQGMFKGQSVTWNLSAASLDRIIGKWNLLDDKLENKLTDENIRDYQIRPNRPEMNVESLSGGNQQKVMLAKWLNTKPQVLIIDEPTCGVDVGTKLEIHKRLRQLASEGVAVILISSDMSEILAISDRIAVMQGGRIVECFDAKDATMEKILEKGLSV